MQQIYVLRPSFSHPSSPYEADTHLFFIDLYCVYDSAGYIVWTQILLHTITFYHHPVSKSRSNLSVFDQDRALIADIMTSLLNLETGFLNFQDLNAG